MQDNTKIGLVIDVNIWISSLLSLPFRNRTEMFFDSEYFLLFSKELFEELGHAVNKPYPAKRIVRSEYEKLVAKLWSTAELIDVHSIVEVCRDPKDNYLLALAKDGNADYLLTGDSGLLVLKEFEKTKIVSLSDFEVICNTGTNETFSSP